ncbi:hypothetical protein PACTADRAFT_48989 [Pachysolen tannophilus NRRL Y-2460]|uniref:Mtf2-like C-terminal domain-containing protein n=1 Tax=Pachysolen tannophilus NRRL Y-2460 TaxID=669874 RepID=A0A1E4TZR5_PACTA|nr:hypothetical protein PACTADRAFT_48989 [Pachysolen tannophilus NRRL Y-2460]
MVKRPLVEGYLAFFAVRNFSKFGKINNKDPAISDWLNSGKLESQKSRKPITRNDNSDGDGGDGDVLDDLTTFGDLYEPSTKSDSILAMDEIQKLLDDLIKTDSDPILTAEHQTEDQKRYSSIRERDVFNNIFQEIMGKQSFSKTKAQQNVQAIVSNDSFNLTNEDIRHTPLSTSSDYYVNRENIDILSKSSHDYKSSQLQKLEIVKSLSTTFEKLNFLFKKNKDLIEYVDKEIIQRFIYIEQTGKLEIEKIGKIEKQNKSLKKIDSSTSQFEEIEKISKHTPLQPVLDHFTLPILVEFILKYSIQNFNSVQDALTIFQSLKTSSVRLYILSCNNDIYNLMIQTVWNYTKDFNQIKSLLKEMKNNGILGDLKTIKILAQIKIEFLNMLHNKNGNLYLSKFDKYDTKAIDTKLHELNKELSFS